MNVLKAAVAAAVAAWACHAPAARAQSSVTLYGEIDSGLTYVTNEGGSHNLKMDDGVMFGNRWGLKGSEDLGGGVKAIFTLEGGYRLGTGQLGQGGLAFGRQAFVGLSSDYGTITFGRQYDSICDFLTQFAVGLNGTGYGTHQGDYDRLAGERLDNAVKFMSVDYSGFSFGGLYSFSNRPGNVHDGSAYTFGAQYARGAFKIGVAYAALFKPTLDPYAAIGLSSFLGQTTATVDPATGVRTDVAPSLVVESSKVAGIGASYAATKSLTLYADVTHNAIAGFGRRSSFNVYEGGLRYEIAPTWTFYGSYQRDTFEQHAWNQFTAGLWYALSKQTSLYLGGEYLRASAGVDPVVGYSFAPSTSNQQTVVRLGMFHFF
ncbi:porin [Burkholderia ubonensis]|uniref:porin n=1 Tax=Burkholderia ubonensis TaxID=101571 RepID=UPI0007549BC5|nr:porin [Burkholderia ubonensis]KUZ82745.1 porin [Burkholderia ubonensis]